MKSSDGGVNWETILSLNSRGFWLTNIFFNNSSNGLIIGGFPTGSFLYRSTDGGNNWIIKTFDYPLNDISFFSKDKGFLIGGFTLAHEAPLGYKLTTSDGGVTWNTISYLGNVIRASTLLNEFTAFAITSRGVFMGIRACEISKTTNYGNDWTPGLRK
ncbi:MAG: hypothetical protein MZV64_14100 [Ignavibacteriales bacterium]|nr:hypothetical protein [Ignavibacteriales bacterium]